MVTSNITFCHTVFIKEKNQKKKKGDHRKLMGRKPWFTSFTRWLSICTSKGLPLKGLETPMDQYGAIKPRFQLA